MLEKTVDRAWIARVYPDQMRGLFQGFWGVFGWGELAVPGGWFSSLSLLVFVNLMGALRYSWWAATPRDPGTPVTHRVWWLCVIATCIGWGSALVRVHLQPIPGAFVWSFGRYTFVAILPSLIILMVGLSAMLPQRLRLQGVYGVLVSLVLFAVLTLGGTLIPYWQTFSAR